MAQPLLVDAVAQARRQMPFRRNVEGSQVLGRQEQRLRRDEVVAVAVNQKDGRVHLDLARHRLGLGAIGQDEQPCEV